MPSSRHIAAETRETQAAVDNIECTDDLALKVANGHGPTA